MQKTYVFSQLVNFTQFDFYAQPGDLAIYNFNKTTITIYRAGDLIQTCELQKANLESMLRMGWIHEEGKSAALPVAVEPDNNEEEIIPDSIPENAENLEDMEIGAMLSKKDIADINGVVVEGEDENEEEIPAASIADEVAPVLPPLREEYEVVSDDSEGADSGWDNAEPEAEAPKAEAPRRGPKAKKTPKSK